MINLTKSIFIILLAIFAFSCASTQTFKQQFRSIDKSVLSGNFDGAIAQLENSKSQYYDKKDRVVYYLDLGLLYHYQGDFAKSNEYLTKADEAIERFYTKSISKIATSLLLNDNAMNYSGEDYEDVYLNLFKALNYVNMNKFDEAFVEIRRVNEKLNLLEDKHKEVAKEYNKSSDAVKKMEVGKNQFHNSSLARYFGILLNRKEGKFDNARIDLQKLKEGWDSQSQIYYFPKPNLDGYLERTNKVKVNFVSLVGRSPEKFAKNLTIHTLKDNIAIYTSNGRTRTELDLIYWDGIKEGLTFKFSLPYLRKNESKVSRVEVLVDGKKYTNLEMIEDLSEVAVETFKIKEPMIYLRTITRTILKGVAAELANQKLDKETGGGFMGYLTRAASGALLGLTENADLRSSRYFPSKVLVGEIELPEGKHQIQLNYYSSNGVLVHSDNLGTKNIQKNNLNLFQSNFLEWSKF